MPFFRLPPNAIDLRVMAIALPSFPKCDRLAEGRHIAPPSDPECATVATGLRQRVYLMLSYKYIHFVYTTMTISPKQLQELENIPENAIDTADIPELDASFWAKAELVKPITKKAISLRVDSDILDWFKSQGKGYQSMMNAVLRSYVEYQIKTNQ